jgi:hypothetical protein
MMTETEWFACSNPEEMIFFLRGRISERKLRLFAVACCRRIWHLMADERSRKVVEVTERHIDGLASEEEWQAASRAAREAWGDSSRLEVPFLYGHPEASERTAEERASIHVLHSATSAAWEISYGGINARPGYWGQAVALGAAREAARALNEDYPRSPERSPQCDLLRDIAGNPFQEPVIVEATVIDWHDRIVPRLAESIYRAGSFDSLPILADALEEAGCMDGEILTHCRLPSEHVCGCWVVDLILGKE